MAHQIVIEFPTKEMADRFCGQMSDGFGEQFVDFSFYQQIPGTDGKSREHYRKVKDELGRDVYFITHMEEE